MGSTRHTQVSGSTPFDNEGTAFASDNARDAIIEATNLATGKARFVTSSVHNGTLSNNQLVGVSNLVNNPIVVPVTSLLSEVTFYQDGGGNRDGEYEFYRNTQSAPNLFFTWTLQNTTTAVAEGGGVDFTSPNFTKGDLLLVYFNDTGANHRDVALFYYFQAT